MAMSHANSGEPVDVRPLGANLAGAQTIALFKSQDLEVIRLVLPEGKSMSSHSVTGEITLQCLEGDIEVVVAGQTTVLQAGHLMYLSGGLRHSFTARLDASALLTIALPR
jgi:quercetin dioxygenase-like cupin family protein